MGQIPSNQLGPRDSKPRAKTLSPSSRSWNKGSALGHQNSTFLTSEDSTGSQAFRVGLSHTVAS